MAAAAPTAPVTTLDIHGLVTVRVSDPSTSVGALAAFASDIDRPADITLTPSGNVDWLGVSLPAGVLRPVVHAAALAVGAFPLHATAFATDGNAVAVSGWSRSGKTGTLLEFLRRGAQFVTAEWSFVSAGRLLPLPDAVRIRGYEMPGARVPARLRARVLARLAERTSRWPALARRFDEARAVDVDPTAWWPVAHGPVPLEVIAFLVPNEDGIVRPLADDDATGRLAAYLRHDLAPLRDAFDAFVFRHGRRDHPVLDRLDELIVSRAQETVGQVRALLVPASEPRDAADVQLRLSAAL